MTSGDQLVAEAAVSADLDVSVNGAGPQQTCTLALRSTKSRYSATLNVAFLRSNVDVQVVGETRDIGDATLSGCGPIADVVSLALADSIPNALAALPPDFAGLGTLDGTCDPDPCTAGFCDTASGSCTAEPITCDDLDPCTADACDRSIGCVSSPAADGTVCGDPCTGDACLSAACVSGTCVEQGNRCDGAELAAFVEGIDDYFSVHSPSALCIPRTTFLSTQLGGATACADTTCNGVPGCRLDLHWSAITASADHLAAQFDMAGTVHVSVSTGGVQESCSLSVSVGNGNYSAEYAVISEANQLGVALVSVDWSSSPVEVSGCGVLSTVAGAFAPFVDSAVRSAIRGDVANVAGYEKTCE